MIINKQNEINSENSITTTNRKSRMSYLDNIRWIVIMLVVLIHINVTYSGIGRWFYMDTGELGEVSYILFAMFGSFVQAFTMGLLFLIAGYFARKSLLKKGTLVFTKDKFIRLGLPVSLFILILNPFTNYIVASAKSGYSINFFRYYAQTFRLNELLGNTGPLWFALALLVFSIVYALTAMAVPFLKRASNKNYDINSKSIVVLIMIITILAFVIRIYQPIGTALYNMQICFFAQYIVLFIVGILAHKYDLFERIDYKLGKRWLIVGILLGLPLWIAVIVLGNVMDIGQYVIFGGMYWQSFAYALWESFFCVSISIGLITVLRQKFNHSGGLNKFLSDNSFGVYVLHTPILVTISILMKDVMQPSILKAITVGLIAIPTCFLISELIRKIPVLKKLLA